MLMMSVLIAGALIGLMAGAAIIVIKIMLLTFNVIKNWFEEKLKERSSNEIPFSYVDNEVRNSLSTAPKVTLGLFNTSTNTISEAASFDADKVEADILEAHKSGSEKVVVYT